MPYIVKCQKCGNSIVVYRWTELRPGEPEARYCDKCGTRLQEPYETKIYRKYHIGKRNKLEPKD